MARERILRPVDRMPGYDDYCNSDWACLKLAEKIGKEGSPRNLNHIFRKAISNGAIKHFYPTSRVLLLLREDVLSFIESYDPNTVKEKSKSCSQMIDYDKIEEIIRRVIKEEFSK